MTRLARSPKDLLRAVTPPIALSAVRRARGRAGWEYLGEAWSPRPPEVEGWNVKSVAETYARRWPALVEAVRGTDALGISIEVPESWGTAIATDDRESHNCVMSFAYVLARSARAATQISVLDWGGGPGHYHLIGKALLPELELDYWVKDTPEVCNRARQLSPEVTFVDDDACLARRYELVLASNSLQYVPDWRSLAARLAEATRSYMYLARVPFVREGKSFTVLQRAHGYGYHTSYQGWVVNRGELLQCLDDANMSLLREFIFAPEVPIRGAESGGFLFAPRG